MTPAIVLLKKNSIRFTIHQYKHDPNSTNFGREAIEKLSPTVNIDERQVFKTLVVCLNGDLCNLAVCVLPVMHQLDLKKAASHFCCKKIELADSHVAQKATGYLVGGISPIGHKKILKTIIDSSASQFQTIFISGGRRGLEVELSPHDLAKTVKGEFVNIICKIPSRCLQY